MEAPGYTSIDAPNSFNFSLNNTNPLSHGANALKLENEVSSESVNQSITQEDVNQVNNQYHEELLKDHQAESIVENTFNEDEVSFAHEAIAETETSVKEDDLNNDLSEFGVDSSAPDLFSSNDESSKSNDLLSSENDEQDDDLEIPAFLRRQKN